MKENPNSEYNNADYLSTKKKDFIPILDENQDPAIHFLTWTIFQTSLHERQIQKIGKVRKTTKGGKKYSRKISFKRQS